MLCVAGCLLDLRDLLPSIPASLLPRTVLYHLSDGAGPLIAGLLGFHGYLPRDASEERILRCLGRVAGGEIDAPRPHLDILLGALESPPITPRDYEILHRLALGQTHDRIGGGVGLSARAVDAHIAELKELFGVESTCALVAVTVGLGLVSPFRDAPPIVWLSDKRVGGGEVEGDVGNAALLAEWSASPSGIAGIRTPRCGNPHSRVQKLAAPEARFCTGFVRHRQIIEK